MTDRAMRSNELSSFNSDPPHRRCCVCTRRIHIVALGKCADCYERSLAISLHHALALAKDAAVKLRSHERHVSWRVQNIATALHGMAITIAEAYDIEDPD